MYLVKISSNINCEISHHELEILMQDRKIFSYEVLNDLSVYSKQEGNRKINKNPISLVSENDMERLTTKTRCYFSFSCKKITNL